MKEKNELDIHSQNDSSAIIANNIEEKSICLDIGCNTSMISQYLVEEKKCKVYGTKKSKHTLKQLPKENSYKEIYDFKINDTSKQTYKAFFEESLKFDYIILNDVLEHLSNPEIVLKQFSKKLKRTGKFIVSLPNIASIDMCKNFINKTLNDENMQILKNDQLFTKYSFFEMIDKMNETYKLSWNVNIIGKITEENEEYSKKYPNLYKLLNKEKEANVIQYVYKIGKNLEKVEEKQESRKDYFELLEKELQDRVLYSQQLKLQRQENVNLLDQIRIEGEVNQKLTKQNDILQEELETITQSKSWKFTKPLRSILDRGENKK